MTVWTASDEGYLRAYQWTSALARGVAMPQQAGATGLGPGEIAHVDFRGVSVSGHFGENKEYRPSFLLVGGPVGLAVTGAASLAHNSAKKEEARRAAIPRWHMLGSVDVLMTNQRLLLTASGQSTSFWYAELTPLQLSAGAAGMPAVHFQPAGQPPLRLESPWVPLLYVFVHFVVDGKAPGVALPADLLTRARTQGRLS